MPYEFLEDVATADIAFRAWGETLEPIFPPIQSARSQVSS
jgi:SHS2 domain-containing protein